MSKSIAAKIRELFQPQAPFWACELTSKHVIVAGVDRSRGRIEGKATVELPPGSITGSLAERNISAPDAVRQYVQQSLNKAAFKGLEIGIVIPDETARISFMAVDKLPTDPLEHQTFIRWKLKKSVPFDVEDTQIAFQVLGPHHANGAKPSSSHDLLVALSPRPVIKEYEDLMESLDLDAGFILPSTLAALRLFSAVAAPPTEDILFLKLAPDCITTAIFQGGRMQFYRRVSGEPLYDAVYPTVLYYQDKLGGEAFGKMLYCGYDEESAAAVSELEHELGIPAFRLEPGNISDIFKAALGAVHYSWASST